MNKQVVKSYKFYVLLIFSMTLLLLLKACPLQRQEDIYPDRKYTQIVELFAERNPQESPITFLQRIEEKGKTFTLFLEALLKEIKLKEFKNLFKDFTSLYSGRLGEEGKNLLRMLLQGNFQSFVAWNQGNAINTSKNLAINQTSDGINPSPQSSPSVIANRDRFLPFIPHYRNPLVPNFIPPDGLLPIEVVADIQGDIPHNLGYHYPNNFNQQPNPLIVNPVFIPERSVVNPFYPTYSKDLESFFADGTLETGMPTRFFPHSFPELQNSISPSNARVLNSSQNNNTVPYAAEDTVTIEDYPSSDSHKSIPPQVKQLPKLPTSNEGVAKMSLTDAPDEISEPLKDNNLRSVKNKYSLQSSPEAVSVTTGQIEGVSMSPSNARVLNNSQNNIVPYAAAATVEGHPSLDSNKSIAPKVTHPHKPHTLNKGAAGMPLIGSPKEVSDPLKDNNFKSVKNKYPLKSSPEAVSVTTGQIEGVSISPSNARILKNIQNNIVPYAAAATVQGHPSSDRESVAPQVKQLSSHATQSSAVVAPSFASRSASTGLESISIGRILEEILTHSAAVTGKIQIEDVSISPSKARVLNNSQNNMVSYVAEDTVTIEDCPSSESNKSVAPEVKQPSKLHTLSEGTAGTSLLGTAEGLLDTLKNGILTFIKNDTPNLQPFIESVSKSKKKIEELSILTSKDDDSNIASYIKEFVISTIKTLDDVSSDISKELLSIAKVFADQLDELYSKCIPSSSQPNSIEPADLIFENLSETGAQTTQVLDESKSDLLNLELLFEEAEDDSQKTSLLRNSPATIQEDIMKKLNDQADNIRKVVGKLEHNNNLMSAIKKVNDRLETLIDLASSAAANNEIDKIIENTTADVVKRLTGSISRKNIDKTIAPRLHILLDKKVAPTLHMLLETKKRRHIKSIMVQFEEVAPTKKLQRVHSNLQVAPSPENKSYKTMQRPSSLPNVPSANRSKYASLPVCLIRKPDFPFEDLIRVGGSR